MKTVNTASHSNERKDCTKKFKYHLTTSIIDKEAAVHAVKSLNLNHLSDKGVVWGNTSVLESLFPESEKKPQCGQVFSHTDSLSRHKVIHSGEMLHQCHQCSQFFSLADSLKQHMFAHGVEKTNKCEKCMQSYKRPHELRKHIKTEVVRKVHMCAIYVTLYSFSLNC